MVNFIILAFALLTAWYSVAGQINIWICNKNNVKVSRKTFIFLFITDIVACILWSIYITLL